MCTLPRPRIEPMSPASAGRLSTTKPPGKFLPVHFFPLPPSDRVFHACLQNHGRSACWCVRSLTSKLWLSWGPGKDMGLLSVPPVGGALSPEPSVEETRKDKEIQPSEDSSLTNSFGSPSGIRTSPVTRLHRSPAQSSQPGPYNLGGRRQGGGGVRRCFSYRLWAFIQC